jgi:hypothetical protein
MLTYFTKSISHISVFFVATQVPIEDNDPKNMMPISPPLPTIYDRRCTATATSPPPPPVPTKRLLQLGKNDGEDFQSFNLFFPSLDDEGEMCDDTTSAEFKDTMEEDDIVCLCTLTKTFNSPLSVENKFATRRVRLKPRFSRNEAIITECSLNTPEAKKMKFTESYETQDLPKLPIGSQGTIFRTRKQVSAREA